MSLHYAPVSDMQPHRLCFGDEVADGEHQPVVDHDAVAGAFSPQCLGAEGVRRDDGMQADDGGERAVEIETVIARTRLIGRWHSPFGQGGHGVLLAESIAPPISGTTREARIVGRREAVLKASFPNYSRGTG